MIAVEIATFEVDCSALLAGRFVPLAPDGRTPERVAVVATPNPSWTSASAIEVRNASGGGPPRSFSPAKTLTGPAGGYAPVTAEIETAADGAVDTIEIRCATAAAGERALVTVTGYYEER